MAKILFRFLALPSTSIRTKQFLLFQHPHPEEEFCQGQSSMEDTTISDSINADMEVCGILNSMTDEDLGTYIKHIEGGVNCCRCAFR